MSNQDQEQQKNPVAEKAKQTAKKMGKKALKKAASQVVKKIAVKALMSAFAILMKVLVAIVGFVGVPALLIIGGITVLVIVVMLATNLMFTEDSKLLDREGREFQQYVERLTQRSIDLNKPEQWEYIVPPELVFSAMQIYEASEKDKTPKEAATIIIDALAPTFTYSTEKGHIENLITTCIEGTCKTVEKEVPFEMNILTSVESWDRQLTTTIQPHTTAWQVNTSYETKYRYEEAVDDEGNTYQKKIPYVIQTTVQSRSHTVVPADVVTENYSYFDMILSNAPFEYKEHDKKMVEALYAMTGNHINYSSWLDGNSLIGFDGVVVPGSSVPTEYMKYYLEAEKKYKVDWYYIAAIHFIETKFSTHPTMVSAVGAEGHVQFMPCTWVGWSYPGCKGSNGFVSIPDSTKHNIQTIKRHGGMGVDGNSDGKADPWNIADAIHSAANKMNIDGFSKNIEGAIRKYNNSSKYVADVQAAAKRFKEEAQYMAGDGKIPNLQPGAFMRPSLGSVSSPYGPRNLKNGFHFGIDLAAASGTSIVATADGTVIKSHSGCSNNGSLSDRCGGGWGNHVYIEHVVQGQKYVVVYAHFSRTMATQGQKVKQGQVVGLMGGSGSVTGVHLHFEIHKNSYNRSSNTVNPAYFIPL